MKVEINGVSYDIPASLSKISLGQKIAFESEHGKILAEIAANVRAITDESDRQMEGLLYQMQVACRSLSFFGGIPLETVLDTKVDDVYNIYSAVFSGMFEQQDNIGLENEFFWDDAFWEIEKPDVTTKSKFTFNEMVVSKQLVKAMQDLGNNEWDGMPYIAAVFLRKKGEAFNEELVDMEGERVKLMHSLPMDIALSVAFFLLVSMNQYIKASPFSAISRPVAASA